MEIIDYEVINGMHQTDLDFIIDLILSSILLGKKVAIGVYDRIARRSFIRWVEEYITGNYPNEVFTIRVRRSLLMSQMDLDSYSKAIHSLLC